MARSSTAALVLRDALVRDLYSVTQVLTGACAGSLAGRWLDRSADSRSRTVAGYIGDLASRALSSGIIRVIEDRGEIVGATLWALHPREAGPVGACEGGMQFDGSPGPTSRDRRTVLLSVAERCRPRHAAHHQLVYLGVRPDTQRRGVGTSLLISHHALLHVTRAPSYVLADDIRARDMFLRHGYSGIGPGRLLPGGLAVWPMWRSPAPADPS